MIRRIRIQNFRSLRDVTVDLEPLTVLIGRSGTGKSNFVKAIRTLRDILLKRNLPQTSTWMPAIGRTLDQKTAPLRLSYEIEYGIDGSNIDQVYTLEIEGYQNSIHVYRESLAHNGNQVFLEQRDPKHPINLSLGALTDKRESTIAHKYLTENIGCYDFPGNVLEANALDSHSPSIPGYLDRGQNYLPTARGIFESLNDHDAWNSIQKSIPVINRFARTLQLIQPHGSRLNVGYKFGQREIFDEVSQESEGLRRYLAHLLALYQDPPKRIAVFEHPEMGIHPEALQALFDEFRNHVDRGRGQVILTTHSPEFLNGFAPEQIRVVDIDNQSTRIGPLAPEQTESVREKYLLPSELLTVDPARLPGQLAEVPV